MRHEFTAVFETQEDWIVAFCPEVPGANGQGRTKEEARKSLADALLQHLRRHGCVLKREGRAHSRGLGIPEIA